MMHNFNAAEVFKVAIRIEENGAKFYRRAAELQTDPKNKKFLEKLAAMEDPHKSTFTKMSDNLVEAEKAQQVFDPEGKAEMYLAAMADTHGGEGAPSAAEALTGSETMEEILKIAIGAAKQ